MSLRQWEKNAEQLKAGLKTLSGEFEELPEFEPFAATEKPERAAEILEETARRLGDNFPYFHPLYAGQMLKPPHPLAAAAYALAMAINPNNHARDGGRASSAMEIEAVGGIAQMFGWSEHLGHLTSGGTFANLEALWVAAHERPGMRIVASEQAHYTHNRISAVLGIEFASVRAGADGRMDLNALEAELKRGDVGTVVATLGTTAIGAVDALDEILKLRERYGFRVHVDAAYGGYFKLIESELGDGARRAFGAIAEADSIVVDPHKHGLQPYGCGCVLFRDVKVGRHYKHDSPYTYFTSKELHLGEISLECSRAGASAVALWATMQLLPLVPKGEFAEGLLAGRRAALELYEKLSVDGRCTMMRSGRPELDIVVWKPRGGSDAAQRIFDSAAERQLHLALVKLPEKWFVEGGGDEHVSCLRSVLMKPEHEAWLGEIWQRLDAATTEVLGRKG
jgi:glutamate/tyrosine decarboxylase-like PLP-dependent enzyme